MEAGLTSVNYRHRALFLSKPCLLPSENIEHLEVLNTLKTSQYQLICPYRGCKGFVPSAVAQELRAEERGEGWEGFGNSWGCEEEAAEPLLAEMAVLELRSHMNRGVGEAVRLKREEEKAGQAPGVWI